jgi:AraC-like DNA-binding protein
MTTGENAAAVRRMQAYIESHIAEPVTLRQLADAAGYSPWHAARVFREQVGTTPFEYLRQVRLSRAAEELISGNGRVVDVALDFVFGSHEGFTRAFTRQFGMSPKKFRDTRPPMRPFLPPLTAQGALRKKRGVQLMEKKPAQTVFVQVIDRPARKLIIKRSKKATGYFEYCEEVPCEIWETLTGVKEALYEPIGMWLPENLRPAGTGVYAQGVEVPLDFSGKVPEGCELTELPPCQMMVFQGPPYDDADFEEAIHDLWEVMKTYNPELYGFRWADEDGPRFQLAPLGYRGYIEARPVRRLNPS